MSVLTRERGEGEAGTATWNGRASVDCARLKRDGIVGVGLGLHSLFCAVVRLSDEGRGEFRSSGVVKCQLNVWEEKDV